jgi:dipeptidyl aminopeptidase/acylaminoacyl peptidase
VTPFHDLHDYTSLDRLTGLRLAPDGSWLAVTVSALAPDGRAFKPSIWRVDTGGGRPAARLTRSAEGEDSPAFLPDGSLVFLSPRPAPPGARPGGQASRRDLAACPGPGTGPEPVTPPAAAQPGPPPGPGEGHGPDPAGQRALWLLPAAGGEACRVVAPPGGVSQLATASGSGLAVFTAGVLPGASGAAGDTRQRQARAEAGVTAILHETPLVRYWDHDLGPDEQRLLVLDVLAGEDSWSTPAAAGPDGAGAGAGPRPRDLTPQPGRALDEHAFELTPDGRVAVTGWSVDDGGGGLRKNVVVIDTGSGERRILLSAPGFDFSAPRISPDGKRAVAIRERHESYDQASALTVVMVPLDAAAQGTVPLDAAAQGTVPLDAVSSGDAAPGTGTETLDLLPGLECWPEELAWAPDGSGVFVTTADHGRGPVLRADLDTGAVTRLTTDHGAYSCLCPSPDGQFLYALRSAMDSPPLVVRLDAARPGEPEFLAGPAARPPLPGRLEEIEATAADGTPLRAWLVLPDSATPDRPAPLLLWVHGGPYSSWNSWSWRWNPWLMAARGYAVLLPDPGLSTGYGHEFLARGHGAWGGLPFTDLMDITDAALTRADLDAGRTAVMGGSFGGYMANWIAGHTTRFRAIVSHAGLWALEQMFRTTDCPAEWRRQLGSPGTAPERYADNSPDRHVSAITTPMLVIHGDKDYRVPVGEALRLWTDLAGRPGHLAGSKFLYFPDENHWVLGPGNARAWYETVFAFLGQHVLGEPWHRPGLL